MLIYDELRSFSRIFIPLPGLRTAFVFYKIVNEIA